MDEAKQRINDLLSLTGNNKTKKIISNFFVKDVKTYTKNLIKLEQEIENNTILLAEANKMFSSLTNEIIRKAEKLEKVVNGLILRNTKETFRRILISGPVYKSMIVKRGHDKPRGYPGDYRIIETFYENKPISKGIGFCGDKHFLKDDYVRAVRDRKNDMKELLYGFIKNSNLTSINILNLGCGSCREIRELFQNYKTKKKIIFTLIDQDEEALRFSKDELKHLPQNITFKFIEENIYNLLGEKNNNVLKPYNMIYSIGLADYLPDVFLGRLLKSCADLLETNGKLIFAHKNIKTYKASAPDWFANWYFFPRNRKDIVSIFETHFDKTKFKMAFKKGKSKRIFFIVIKKTHEGNSRLISKKL